MMQDMDDAEKSCILYVKVSMFDQLKQSEIGVLTVTKLRIVRHSIQHAVIVSINFMEYPGDFLRQTLADILSFKEFAHYI